LLRLNFNTMPSSAVDKTSTVTDSQNQVSLTGTAGSGGSATSLEGVSLADYLRHQHRAENRTEPPKDSDFLWMKGSSKSTSSS
jgi:hypothetical protein